MKEIVSKIIIINKVRLFFALLIFTTHMGAQVSEIPIEVLDGTIYIDVNINESKIKKRFIFDTGATTDLIDSISAIKLGLKSNHSQSVLGAAGAKKYRIALNQKIKLSDSIEITDNHLVIADLTKLKSRKDFDGIIGYSLIKKYIVEIDYDNNKMKLYNKEDELDTKGYQEIMLGSGLPIPQFEISFKTESGETFKGIILFDTGAGLELLVNSSFVERHNLSSKFKEKLTHEINSLSSESKIERVVIQSMNIEGFKLGEMPIGLSNSKSGIIASSGLLGVLGAKVISRFNFILDYNSSKIYLKPNKFFHQNFDFPLTGFKIQNRDGYITVKHIDKNCPSYIKGLRKGDRILSINDNDSNDIGVYKKMLSTEGLDINMTFLNNQSIIRKIHLKLKRLL